MSIIIKFLQPYLYFLFITSFLMFCISDSYNKRIVLFKYDVHKIIFLFLSFVFILVVVLFSSFRVIGAPEGASFVRKGIYTINSQIFIYPGGADAPVYKKIFEESKNLSLLAALKSFNGIEFGYILFSFIFSKLFGSFEIFLCFNYLLMSLALITICKTVSRKNDLISYLLFTFTILTIFVPSFNTFRNNFVVILSIYIINEFIIGKDKNVIILTIFLMTIHTSAVIWFLPLFMRLCLKRFKNKKQIFIILIILFSLSSFFLKYLMSLIPRYNHYSKSGGSISYFWLLSTTVIILEVILRQKSFLYCNANKNLFLIFLSFLPVFVFQLNFYIFYRFMIFSRLVGYIILCKITNLKSKNSLQILFNLVNIVILFLVILGFFQDIYWCGIPYKNLLW